LDLGAIQIDPSVNLLGDKIDTIKKNEETLIDATNKAGLEVNTEKTKYMLMPHHQNAGQNHLAMSHSSNI
jgi:hypothetical protein